MLGSPSQLFMRDGKLCRVPRANISLTQELEATPFKFRATWPGFYKRRGDLLALRPQEIESMRFW